MNYQTMKNMIADRTYLHAGRVEDVDYYAPNDEDLGCIVGVHHSKQLVKTTDFYEMDDIYPMSDYAFVECAGSLVARFEIS